MTDIDDIGETQNLVNWKRIVLKKSPLELAETLQEASRAMDTHS